MCLNPLAFLNDEKGIILQLFAENTDLQDVYWMDKCGGIAEDMIEGTEVDFDEIQSIALLSKQIVFKPDRLEDNSSVQPKWNSIMIVCTRNYPLV